MILNIAEKAQFAYNDGDQKAKSRVKNLEKFLEKQQHQTQTLGKEYASNFLDKMAQFNNSTEEIKPGLNLNDY